MYPYLTLGPVTLPTYWLCTLLGLCAAGALFLRRWRRFGGFAFVDVTNALGVGAAGALLGAWGLYLLTILPILWQNRALLAAQPALWGQVLPGLVYYGGLFGALAAAAGYLRYYRLSTPPFFDLLAPCVPLFHAIARVGCFLTGCCHGVESSRFGLAFSQSPSAPNGVPYFPVQLLEAAVELCLFIILLCWERRGCPADGLLPRYLALYAAARFLLEFLRGDAVRGVWGPFSTSQWLSLLVLAVLLLRRARAARA